MRSRCALSSRAWLQSPSCGTVLQSHFRTAAFDTLRTEELAYAVGAFAPSLDHYAGFGLYIQTPIKSVADMQARFDKFKDEYWTQLEKMTEDEFAQLKQSALVTLKETPKNMREEVAPILSDLALERYDFDSKEQLIKAVENTSLADAKAFYKDTLMNQTLPVFPCSSAVEVRRRALCRLTESNGCGGSRRVSSNYGDSIIFEGIS